MVYCVSDLFPCVCLYLSLSTQNKPEVKRETSSCVSVKVRIDTLSQKPGGGKGFCIHFMLHNDRDFTKAPAVRRQMHFVVERR